MIALFPQKCLKCGWEWSSETETSTRCPKCFSVDYDIVEKRTHRETVVRKRPIKSPPKPRPPTRKV